jgi:hypothetical protein
MIMVLGALTVAVTLVALGYRPVRDLEADVPDWDAAPAPEAA